MSETRRVEAKNVSVDVYKNMKAILRYTGESQSKFIQRAIQAEVEKHIVRIRQEMARRNVDKIAQQKRAQARLTRDEQFKQDEKRIKNEIAQEQRYAEFKMGKREVF